MDNYNSVYVNHLNQELAGSLPGWTVVRQIGKGAYGEVYEIHRTTGNFLEKAALKVLRIPKNSTEAKHLQFQGASAEEAEDYYREYVDNTLKEIALMQRLVGNSYIVSYEDYAVRKRENSIGWDIYIRMELLTSLPDYLKIHPAEEDMVLQLGMDISRGLWDCHREGIIHRDIKPQNIFVNQSGGFKIGDFGVARFTPGSQGNLSFKGTIAYMAPEVFYQKGTDARSDIYSLGMVMYQCLNDYRLPFFPGDSPRKMWTGQGKSASPGRRCLPRPMDQRNCGMWSERLWSRIRTTDIRQRKKCTLCWKTSTGTGKKGQMKLLL